MESSVYESQLQEKMQELMASTQGIAGKLESLQKDVEDVSLGIRTRTLTLNHLTNHLEILLLCCSNTLSIVVTSP